MICGGQIKVTEEFSKWKGVHNERVQQMLCWEQRVKETSPFKLKVGLFLVAWICTPNFVSPYPRYSQPTNPLTINSHFDWPKCKLIISISKLTAPCLRQLKVIIVIFMPRNGQHFSSSTAWPQQEEEKPLLISSHLRSSCSNDISVLEPWIHGL